MHSGGSLGRGSGSGSGEGERGRAFYSVIAELGSQEDIAFDF